MSDGASPTPRERIAGCLLGGAIGDALGAGIEFDSLAQIRARHGDGGVTGYVPAYGAPGRITDDTQMTLFTAEGLLRAAAGGRLDVERAVDATRSAYLRWHDTQISVAPKAGDGWLVTIPRLRHRRAPGYTCLSALHAGGTGTPQTPLNDSKGCGGVMRVAPLAFAGMDSFDLAARAAALTHGHPSGYLSAAAFAAMIEEVFRGGTLQAAVETGLGKVQAAEGGEETAGAIAAAVALAAEGPSSAETLETLGGGWVGEEALAIAVYCALAEPDVRHALLLAVNHSGDSDSTGALVGNLLGVLHGVQALPGDLLEAVELREEITTVADDLAGVFVDAGAPDADRYPPD